jgi:hypothetical protein
MTVLGVARSIAARRLSIGFRYAKPNRGAALPAVYFVKTPVSLHRSLTARPDHSPGERRRAAGTERSGMLRTKWLRLTVRDLGDVMRWAGEQNARRIEDFRYRIIDGRESVSFRLVPDYAIRVGTHDIIVVAHVRPQGWRPLVRLWRRIGADFAAGFRRALAAATVAEPMLVLPAPNAGVIYAFPAARSATPARG